MKKIISAIVNKTHLSLLVILLITGAIYINTFLNEFTVDDLLFIVDWPMIRDLGNWPQFFGAHNQPIGEEGVYSPLKTCFHALNFHLFGYNTFGYHLAALIINFLGVIAVYKLSLLIAKERNIAFLCALFFGLHPVHVEAVGNMTGSIDSSGIVLLFWSFYYFIRSGKEEARRLFLYCASIALAALAVFTHELAITIPVLFFFYSLVYEDKGQSLRRKILTVSPFAGIVVFYIILKAVIAGSITRGGYLFDSFYLTMLVIIKALAKYVLIMFFPVRLVANHQISPGIYSVDWQYFDKTAVLTQSIFDARVLLASLLTIAVIYIGIRFYKRRPLISFCIGWFYICLIPVMNFIPTGTYFTERYLYPGSFGFCLLTAYVFNELLRYKEIRWYKLKNIFVVSFIILICAFYSVRTVLRNADFRNEMTFYRAEVNTNPDHALMNRNYGANLLNHHRPEEAVRYLRKALTLMPGDTDALFVLAQCYEQLHNFKLAIEAYQEAIRFDPEFAEAYFNLAGIYEFLGRGDDSRKYLEKSIRLYRQQGRDQEARELQDAVTQYFQAKQKE